MGVFDAIVIRNTPGVDAVVIARTVGPLEQGHYKEYVGGILRWIPDSPNPQMVLPATDYPQGGFGVDSSGRVYYDTNFVDQGEGKDLWVDPFTGRIWLGDET